MKITIENDAGMIAMTITDPQEIKAALDAIARVRRECKQAPSSEKEE